MKKLILFIITFSLYLSIYGCNCDEINRDSAIIIKLRNSDIVFCGEFIENDPEQEDYTFRIIEIFKGKYDKDYIYGNSHTKGSVFPTEEGIWIVYANFKDDKTIEINSCSKSLIQPYDYEVIPPDSRNLKDTIESIEREIEKNMIWISDYEKLKSIKSKNDNHEKNIYKILLLILLISNIILITILIKKKRNASC